MKEQDRSWLRRTHARTYLGMGLLFMMIACSPTPPIAVTERSPQTSQPLAIFSALRYPDTIDSKGPYPVSVLQLAGPDVTGGHVVYSVLDSAGKRAEGQVELRRLVNENGWTAEIPGQSLSSTITYHFSFNTPTVQSLRHPARAPASYRFRVVPLRILSLTLPQPVPSSIGGLPATLLVQAASPPSGALILRLLSSSDTAREQRIALSVAEKRDKVNEPNTYALKAMIPELRPGELADFYFQVNTADGVELRVPQDAPARVYSVKRSIRQIQHLPSDGAFVLDIGSFGQERWTGLKGEGVSIWEANGRTEHWGLENRLPSGVARFVLPDSVSGNVYIGTDRGVIAIEPGGALVAVTAPHPSSWQAQLSDLSRLRFEQRAGPGAVSTLDGTLLFQLQGAQVLEQAFPVAVFLQLQDGKLSVWQAPALRIPLVGLSSATFDTVDGCWLLGGFVHRGEQELQPAVIRRCGETVEEILLQDLVASGVRTSPKRIVALARDPSSGGLVVGLEFLTANGSQPRKDFGVYRVDDASGQLSALVPETTAIGAEVTALATDWSRGRILVGTVGKGLLLIQKGIVQNLSRVEGFPSELTTLRVEEKSGSVLVGTSHGAFELSSDLVRVIPFGPSGEGPVLTDALPMDVEPVSGHVLVSSYSSGLDQLEREESGQWHVIESLRPGHELPTGLFGDAKYNRSGGLSVILQSQGLLRIENHHPILLGTPDGLYSTNLLRLLVRSSGDTWLAYTPLPFGTDSGAALQVLKDSKVVLTVKVADRDLATIGRWIEEPERNSVFAATRVGVVEIRGDGTMMRVSSDSVTSIARDPQTGSIGVVGTAIERWENERFVPVLFRVDHPRWPKGQFQTGAPIDIAIDKTGVWYLLFRGGILALLDSQGEYLNLLDSEDGIPSTANRLMAYPTTGDIFVGSGGEGMLVVAPQGHP